MNSKRWSIEIVQHRGRCDHRSFEGCLRNLDKLTLYVVETVNSDTARNRHRCDHSVSRSSNGEMLFCRHLYDIIALAIDVCNIACSWIKICIFDSCFVLFFVPSRDTITEKQGCALLHASKFNRTHFTEKTIASRESGEKTFLFVHASSSILYIIHHI